LVLQCIAIKQQQQQQPRQQQIIDNRLLEVAHDGRREGGPLTVLVTAAMKVLKHCIRLQ